MADPIIIVPYDPTWASLFTEIGARLRDALGRVALRIDHIGSTSVPRMAAKPVTDIQVSVASFDPIEAIAGPMEGMGYVFRRGNPELSKRYFREAPGTRLTHIHVRLAGSWSEQFALLFRDYLRSHEEEAHWYAEIKYQLAEQYRDDRDGYTDAKGPYLWETMKKADRWNSETGRVPGPSDA